MLIIFLGLTSSLTGQTPKIEAQVGSSTPQLIISQIKITSSAGQFIVLYNNANTPIDLSSVQLEYFNNFDLRKATSGKLISLSGSLPPHGYYIVNDESPLLLCYQATVNSGSLGLSSSAGFVRISRIVPPSPSSLPATLTVLDDFVSWSNAKTLPAGVQTFPTAGGAFLVRQPLDSQGRPSILSPGSGSWGTMQPDNSNPCNFVVSGVSDSSLPLGGSGGQLLPGTPPKAKTVNSASSGDSAAIGSSLPARDVGLISPQITELLPNPAAPQTDADDEFVELYNPNDVVFDLSGFVLEAGTTTIHRFTFEANQLLQPHQFQAFYSSLTSLSLSNEISQVRLLDPSGNVINQSGAYTKAKDGQAWVVDGATWQWSNTPTPNASNIVNGGSGQKSATNSKSGKNSVGAADPKVKSATTGDKGSTPSKPKLHTLVLAGIGALAVIYACYEYRHDLANLVYRFRRYRENRQSPGQIAQGRRNY